MLRFAKKGGCDDNHGLNCRSCPGSPAKKRRINATDRAGSQGFFRMKRFDVSLWIAGRYSGDNRRRAVHI